MKINLFFKNFLCMYFIGVFIMLCIVKIINRIEGVMFDDDDSKKV